MKDLPKMYHHHENKIFNNNREVYYGKNSREVTMAMKLSVIMIFLPLMIYVKK